MTDIDSDRLPTLRDRTLVRIVDDDEEIVGTLSLMLGVDGWRTAGYPSAEAFLVGDTPSEPGCVLLDIQMGGMSGIDLQLEMVERGYVLPVIFITGHASVETAVDAMRRGAFDFLQKPVDPTRLLESIRQACDKSLSESSHEPSVLDVQRAADELTERQLDIVRRLLRGEKTREIADALDISLRTVQGHKLAIYRKFGVHTAAQFAELGPVLGVESGSET